MPDRPLLDSGHEGSSLEQVVVCLSIFMCQRLIQFAPQTEQLYCTAMMAGEKVVSAVLENCIQPEHI